MYVCVIKLCPLVVMLVEKYLLNQDTSGIEKRFYFRNTTRIDILKYGFNCGGVITLCPVVVMWVEKYLLTEDTSAIEKRFQFGTAVLLDLL